MERVAEFLIKSGVKFEIKEFTDSTRNSALAAQAPGCTGHPVGGVPPLPHSLGVVVLPDASQIRFREVWATAGAPDAVFRMEVPDALHIVGRDPDDLSE